MTQSSDPALAVSMEQAKALGFRRFVSDNPCVRGHRGERYTKNGRCVTCISEDNKKAWQTRPESIRESCRKWREKNPTKSYQAGVRWQQAHPDEARQARLAWVAQNRGKIREYNRLWHSKNVAKRNAKCMQYRLANKEKFRTFNRNYYLKNKGKFLISAALRRARKRSAEGEFSRQDVFRLYEAQRKRCAYCRNPLVKKYHVDHIIPLCRGGSNWPRNLQILCPSCNLRKQAKHPIDFARRMGMLI